MLSEGNNIYTISVPVNCTDKLQPMDLIVNKTLKDFMKNKFNEWYSSLVYKILHSENPSPADFWLLNALKTIKEL